MTTQNDNGPDGLKFGGIADVPREVATCPECDGGLKVDVFEWDNETGKPVSHGIYAACIRDEEDEEWFAEREHWYHDDDWQPVVDVVERWAGCVEA